MEFAADLRTRAKRLPPQMWFGISAVFHYLGPSFAVLLFPSIGVLGTAWLRIAGASLILGPPTHVVETWKLLQSPERAALTAFGLCLAAMNCTFYMALRTLPLSLVAAIEFGATLLLAFCVDRSRRNLVAVLLAGLGVSPLLDIVWADDRIGLIWAFLNAALFAVYISLGHHLANVSTVGAARRLGLATTIALFCVFPIGLGEAVRAFAHPKLVLAGFGVGLCSSVIPYLCDQLAMARLPKATFALMLALLPVAATAIGAIVLHQVPAPKDLLGILLVMSGLAVHHPPATKE